MGQFLDVQVACLDASNGTVDWAGEQVLRSQCGMGSASGGMIPWILSSECWCWQWLWCRVTTQPQTQLSGSLTLFSRAAQNGEGNRAFVHKPQHKGRATSRGTVTTHRPRQAALCFAHPNIQCSSSSCACIGVWSGRRGPTLHVSPGTEAAPLVRGGGSHSHKAEHRVCATAGGGVTFHSCMQGALGSRKLVL